MNVLFGVPTVAVRGKTPINPGRTPLVGPLPEGADGVAVRLGLWPGHLKRLVAVHADALTARAWYRDLDHLGLGHRSIARWLTPSGGSIWLLSAELDVQGCVGLGRGAELRGNGTIVVAPPTPGYTLVGQAPRLCQTGDRCHELQRCAYPGQGCRHG